MEKKGGLKNGQKLSVSVFGETQQFLVKKIEAGTSEGDSNGNYVVTKSSVIEIESETVQDGDASGSENELANEETKDTTDDQFVTRLQGEGSADEFDISFAGFEE